MLATKLDRCQILKRLMSDYEEEDLFWKTLISPVKRKRKKTLKKDKKCEKHETHNAVKTDESMQKKKKKKKKCKFTDAMEKRKEKKREKKEKKKKLPVSLDHSFIFTQGYLCVSDPSAKTKPESPHPRSTERENPHDQTQGSKNKRKKKVVWDLSQPDYIRVKRPKFVSSTPKQNNQSEEDAVRNCESFTQVTETTTSQPQDNDSQCTGDDINSQDLFITQKTCRSSPPERSSGEMSDKGVFISTPTPDTQREEGSNIHLLQPHFYQKYKKTKQPQSLKTVRIEEEEEEERLQPNPKRETLSFQKQMAFKEKFMEERKVCAPVHVKPSVVNPYLDEPVVLNLSKSKPDTCSPGQRSPSHLRNTAEPSLLLQILKANISTQTENFFTAELCAYLNFCQKRKETLTSESWKPLDLSLPQRVRRDVVTATEIRGDEAERNDQKTSPLPDEMKDGAHKDSSRQPCCSSEMKDAEVKKEPSGWSRLSVSSLSKGKTTRSPLSESEAKSANSSEDSEPPCSTGKPDLTQNKAGSPSGPDETQRVLLFQDQRRGAVPQTRVSTDETGSGQREEDQEEPLRSEVKTS
ncbi:hypothetical protein INR49_005107 [Caranx melampygus]|nr:hypothetical protein INR49_005107 [Caranx melampygus]